MFNELPDLDGEGSFQLMSFLKPLKYCLHLVCCKYNFNRTVLLVYIKCVPSSHIVSLSFFSACHVSLTFQTASNSFRHFVVNFRLWLTVPVIFTDFVAFV